MRRPLTLLLLLSVAAAPAASAEQAEREERSLHASYDVHVWDGTAGRFRTPTPEDGLPEHWEWWTTISSATDANARQVEAKAYHQALWKPDADWVDLTVTYVDGAGKIVREDSKWLGTPPFYSDVGFNFGANGFQLTAAGPTQANQTVEASRFGEGSLPCGHGALVHGERLAIGGSCGRYWPSGELGRSELSFERTEDIQGRPAALYQGDGVQAWMFEDVGAPARILADGIMLTLVGFREDATPDFAAPSIGIQSPLSMPWDLSSMEPWGLAEDGAEHGNPFPASQAYEAALKAPLKSPLAVFMLEHPDARPFAVHATSWKAGERLAHRWDFLIADDRAVWNGSVVQEVEGLLTTTTAYGQSQSIAESRLRLPRLAVLPKELPMVASVLARWSAWTGEPATAGTQWGYSVACADFDCTEVEFAVVGGRELWQFPTQRLEQSLMAPSRMQGTSSLAEFRLDASPITLVESDWQTSRVNNVGFSSFEGGESTARGAAARLWGVEDGQRKAIAGFALVGALSALAYRFLPVAVGLYARIRTDTLPEHPTRAAILQLVETTPGIRYSDLLRILGGGKGALEYHLRLLENGGHLVLLKRNGLATYFRTRQAAEGHAMAWLRSTTARRILGLLAEQPRPQSALHSLAGCSRSTAHTHLVRIEAAGLVRRQDGLAAITDAGLTAWDAVREGRIP